MKKLLLPVVLVLLFAASAALAAPCDANPCTHAAAIGDAHYATVEAAFAAAQTGETVILLRNAELSQTIALSDRKLTLLGGGHTLTSAGSHAFFSLSSTAELTIGAIDGSDTLIIDGKSAAVTSRDQAMLCLTGKSKATMMAGVTLRNNQTQFATDDYVSLYQGAAVTVADTASFTMNGGTIANNVTNIGAKGIFAGDSATLTIKGGTVSGNRCTGTSDLGAIWVFENAKGTLENCLIEKNTSTAQYGVAGLNINSAQKTVVTNCTIRENASGGAGGIVVNNGEAKIAGCVITKNSGGSGGGISITNAGSALVQNSKITFNTATNQGGGVYMQGIATLQAALQNSIYGNRAGKAGDDVVYAPQTAFGNQLVLPTPTGMTPDEPGLSLLENWYVDSENNRYHPDTHAEAVDKLTYVGNDPVYLCLPKVQEVPAPAPVPATGDGFPAAWLCLLLLLSGSALMVLSKKRS